MSLACTCFFVPLLEMRGLIFIFSLIYVVGLRAQTSGDVNRMLCMSGPQFNIQFPTIFTPNNDFVNDRYLPIITNELCIESYYMGIYNRWGQLLYETNVYSVGWHGNNFNGDHFPEGTYYFLARYRLLKINDLPPQEITQKGVFTLVR